MTNTATDEKTAALLYRVFQEGLISYRERALIHVDVESGKELFGTQRGAFELRNEFGEHFRPVGGHPFPGDGGLLEAVLLEGLLGVDLDSHQRATSGALSARSIDLMHGFRTMIERLRNADAAESDAPRGRPKVEGKLTALNEDSRTYRFAGADIELTNVRELIIRPSGSHRVRTADGRLHVIAAGWLAITIVDKSQEWTV